jgi:hypothetical protein
VRNSGSAVLVDEYGSANTHANWNASTRYSSAPGKPVFGQYSAISPSVTYQISGSAHQKRTLICRSAGAR